MSPACSRQAGNSELIRVSLTWLPLDDRVTALVGINNALQRVKGHVESAIPSCRAALAPQNNGQETKLTCQTQDAQIKVEVNTIIRGSLLPPRMKDVVYKVEDDFGRFVSINVVSNAELFGGKICAALDRQHPRDLFDVHHMLKKEGLTDEIRMGFIAFLLSRQPSHP